MEPVAVVGIGLRFPGASGTDAFWRLLCEGGDAIVEVPPDRWDLDAFYDEDPRTPGKLSTRWAGLLERVDLFDRKFFGILPREAAVMDPLQRLLLEVSYEALEDGGQPLEPLAGGPVGVFMGVPPGDFGRLLLAKHGLTTPFTGTGALVSIAANRISYAFDFSGPSIALDTACSSSLVAVHLACQSLRTGDCEVALAGGVNVILTPDLTIAFSKAGAMAPDGRCKAFDAAADGYVRSEGAGVVVLKTLAKAEEDGDRIYAVILGSAVNQDGRTNGLTAPNRWSQERVVGAALANAGVEPGRVQFVETHGTGTALGDAIEAKALGAVIGAKRPAGHPCALGSVKTNIGHLETAAGVASLIKLVLCLRHRKRPPNLHFNNPNPFIPFDELGLRVQASLEDWRRGDDPFIGGVSSFGFGGTNAHAVLTAYDAPAPLHYRRDEYLLPISARTEESLHRLAAAYRDRAAEATEGDLYDIAYTASKRRNHFSKRAVVLFRTPADLVQGLARLVHVPAAEIPSGYSEALTAAANGYLAGDSPDWDSLYSDRGRCVSLPAYCWDSVRCWYD